MDDLLEIPQRSSIGEYDFSQCPAVDLSVDSEYAFAKACSDQSPVGLERPVAGQIVTHEQYGAVLQKGSRLTITVDAVMKTLTKNGTVGKLQKKWFNLNFAKIPSLK